jgi:hypothetical protein
MSCGPRTTLRLPGFQRSGQGAPMRKDIAAVMLQFSADISWLVAVEVEIRCQRVRVPALLSRSSMPSATNASKKSLAPRSAIPSLAPSCSKSSGPSASAVNTPSSTALSNALAPRNAWPSVMIRSIASWSVVCTRDMPKSHLSRKAGCAAARFRMRATGGAIALPTRTRRSTKNSCSEGSSIASRRSSRASGRRPF